MKFLHLSDLHIGKKLNEYPLYEDQRFVLNQAISLAKEQNVDAIVIAGDVYDSGAPTAEAMDFYDWLLASLHELGKPILIISGNHDSAERLHVASTILRHSQIYIVTRVEDALAPVEIEGVRFYLLPYFRPSDVNYAFGTECRTYEAAMSAVLEKLNLDLDKPNVLVTHQSILPVGAKIESSGSETALDIDTSGSVGGTETIDVSLFSAFDYLALGHIHKAQFIAENARYPGALLKYHVKEANAKRSFTIVEMKGKDVHVEEHPLVLMRDLLIVEGTLEDLLHGEGNEKDYIQARLLDEATVDSPYNKLKAKYPYLLGLDYARALPSFVEEADFENVEDVRKEDLFATFFEKYGGRALEEDERALVEKILEEVEA